MYTPLPAGGRRPPVWDNLKQIKVSSRLIVSDDEDDLLKKGLNALQGNQTSGMILYAERMFVTFFSFQDHSEIELENAEKVTVPPGSNLKIHSHSETMN